MVVARQGAVAVGGVVAWGIGLAAVLDRSSTSTWLVLLALVQLVPISLLANHFLAGFEGEPAEGRRWAWILAAGTWLPPVAVVVSLSYLEAAGARRRPNPYGVVTDPPRRGR